MKYSCCHGNKHNQDVLWFISGTCVCATLSSKYISDESDESRLSTDLPLSLMAWGTDDCFEPFSCLRQDGALLNFPPSP